MDRVAYIFIAFQMKGLMIVGIDTYHDSAKKGRSVGAFITSLNKQCTMYYSRCIFQHSGQELTDDLKVCLQGIILYTIYF